MLTNQTLDIIRYDVYRNSNVGIYINTNDEFVFVPNGFAKTKAKKLSAYLKNNFIFTSIANTRLIGILMVVNNYGMLLPKTCLEEEIEYFKKNTDLNIYVLDSKYTALGNIIAVNDNGGIISPRISKQQIRCIQDSMGVEMIQIEIAGYHQVGAMISANAHGGIINPDANETDIQTISDILKVNIEQTTVNGGVKFVSSGMLINNKSVIVGQLTNGSEMITINRSFIR